MNAVVITGATSGIGFAVGKALLDAGYAVIGIGRSEKNCEAARAALSADRPSGLVYFIRADLMQQREVKRAAAGIKSILRDHFGGKLHTLINNVGCVRSRFMTTEEGYEQQFALNYLAGFLLTGELLSVIKASGASVIFTSSRSHKLTRVNWRDLMYRRRYNPLFAYKQSKLCNLLLALKLRNMGIRACGVDPGLVATDIGNKETFGAVDFVWRLRKKHGVPPEIPAATYLSLCENGFDGLYYGFGAKECTVSSAVNQGNAQKLYDISLRLCGMEEYGS